MLRIVSALATPLPSQGRGQGWGYITYPKTKNWYILLDTLFVIRRFASLVFLSYPAIERVFEEQYESAQIDDDRRDQVRDL